ncbi:threonine/serine exporter family protein [Agromyces endophyticus]|uniref:threonine/serine ThrE exporter family protein n=1 Tax=Agromyces sp. H17E-10 TaxID=2932244 RepID=UPI001FD1564B|nr:threonine/serine exporter family protein [Agromyces sp. H17E-10]UOQ87743.1 threonine/serine exporter family protein [Agromyces sp. H17E-10]
MAEADVVDRDLLRSFLLGLAEGMNAAAESVAVIHDTLVRVSKAYGRDDTDVVVLPTVVLVQTGGGREGHVAVRSAINASFRFDQIAELYTLIGAAERAEISPLDGIRRLNEIGAMKPRRGWVVRTLGHAILVTGLALLLTPTWQGAVIAFGLGAFVGLAKLVRSPTLQLVFPVFAAFVCALAVFLIAPYVEIGDPIRLLIAPLATFLPGGVLTTAVAELAVGQMLSGASRLVFGLVQLALLAFGILAAGTLVGVESSSYAALEASAPFPWWTAIAGVLLFAIGNYLHFSAPRRTFGWVLLVLVVAYLGQQVGTILVGSTVSGFIGALAMTPVVLWIAALPHGAPSQLTFLPGFWLLVPGAAGLVGLTEAVGTTDGLEDFATALTAVMSIALGVLIGTALYRVVHHGAEELAEFHIDVPAALADEQEPPFWARLVPGTPRSLWGGRRRHRRRGRPAEPSTDASERASRAGASDSTPSSQAGGP